MRKLFDFLLKKIGLDGHEEIEEVKSNLFSEKERAIKDLKRINKRFRFIIEADSINLVIKDIDEIRKGK